MSRQKIQVLAVELLVVFSSAWTFSRVPTARRGVTYPSQQATKPIAIFISLTPPDSEDTKDEKECNSEDECEIDWDAMPGFEQDDEEETEQKEREGAINQSNATEKCASSPILEYDDFENHVFPIFSASTTIRTGQSSSTNKCERDQKQESLLKENNCSINWNHRFMRMEMTWQMTESAKDCDVENPFSCGSEPCEGCRGRGYIDCRFCGGTHFLNLGGESDDFFRCKICDSNGQEVCHSCQGSGWVAQWTFMATTSIHGSSFKNTEADGSNSVSP